MPPKEKRPPAARPHCSIIMPAFNAEVFIGEAIESVLGQTYGNWELLVIDDGSQDATAERVGTFEDQRIRLIRQRNLGVSAARNRGLAEAEGDIVCFLDADDRLRPHAVERHLSVMAEHAGCAATYGEAVLINPQGRVTGPEQGPLLHARPSGDILQHLLCQNCIVAPGVLAARRTAIEAAGDFNPALRLLEDWEYWCRLALQGPFQYLGPSPVLEYRHHPGSAIRAQGFTLADADKSIDAVFSNPQLVLLYAPEVLDRCLRRAEASACRFLGDQHLLAQEWAAAEALLRKSLRREPRRIREWILWACARIHWLPAPIARRIK